MKDTIKQIILDLGYDESVLDEDQENRVNLWASWLKGKTKEHQYRIYNGKKYVKKEFKSLNICSQSCSDLGDFFFNEKLEITIDKPGVQEKIDECLEQNNFLENGNKLVQLTKALGTGAFVPYLDDGVLKINFINANNIIILKADRGEIQDVLFFSEAGNSLYVNIHILGEDGYTILNKKFNKVSDSYVEEILDDKFAIIPTKSFIPKFQIITTPEINNFDINSPYGISCYANALDTIIALDRAYDSFDNEIALGRKRIYVPAKSVQFNIDANGNTIPAFDDSDTAFYVYPGSENEKLVESSFDLRIEQITQAIQAQLNIYTAKVGLGHNYYKFKNGEAYVNTSNVISSNSDVYRKIKKQENILTRAITGLCYAIAELIGITEEFSVSVFYDDSIIEDTDSIRKQAQTEYNTKLISKAQYYRDVYKLKDDEALAFAQQMNEEIKNESLIEGEEETFVE